MSDYDVVVVGAGIAGLGVATQLQQSGKKTLLLEMYPRTGHYNCPEPCAPSGTGPS